MSRSARLVLCAPFAVALACGGGDDKVAFTGSSGGAAASSGGASAAGGAPASGTTGAGGATAGAAGTIGVGGERVCRGTRTPSGACFIPCTYAPGFPPRYESPPGPCTDVGWKCSPLQHCNPNTPCANDAACATLGGPGYRCLDSSNGQFDGQCGISCNTDADCPQSSAPSPYLCKEVENGSGAPPIKVCRF